MSQICLAYVSCFQYFSLIWKMKMNQRTSRPVNAHLTPGPGIYFNAFIHVYSPRAGADNPLGTNDVNSKPLSLCPFVASFKTIPLKYDFLPLFKDGWVRVLRPFNSISVISRRSAFYVFFLCVYSPRQGQTTQREQKFYDNRKTFSLCPYVASFKMISLKSDFIHIFNDFIHVYSPGARTENPLGTNF